MATWCGGKGCTTVCIILLLALGYLFTFHSGNTRHATICNAYSQWGSNPQPMAHKTIALTTEL